MVLRSCLGQLSYVPVESYEMPTGSLGSHLGFTGAKSRKPLTLKSGGGAAARLALFQDRGSWHTLGLLLSV